MDFDLEFLQRLLSAPGTSAFEARPAAVWRDRAGDLGAKVRTDGYGNAFAEFADDGSPTVMVAGHIDEIGLMVSYIDEGGLLFVREVGGWDPQQLVGQRVRVVGHGREIFGVVGRNAVHLEAAEPRGKATTVKDLWIDVGAGGREDLEGVVRPGDFAVTEQPLQRLLGDRIASKALDNRLGAFLALEATAGAAGPARRVAVATVQEEISGVGARTATHALRPDLALVLDMTHATDTPGIDKRQEGERGLGSGPELAVGSFVHRGLLERLIDTASEVGVPFTLAASPRRTGTDADHVAGVHDGIPTAVVSVPIRYMHSPNEIASLADVESTSRLLTAFLEGLDGAFVQSLAPG